MRAFDTNVWIYLYDKRYPEKQAIAERLVDDVDLIALPWQVGCEFLAASRKLAASQFSPTDAWNALEKIRGNADAYLMPDLETWDIARNVYEKHNLSFWDTLLLAICVQHRVTHLYTEDFGTPRLIEDVQIINPFLNP